MQEEPPPSSTRGRWRARRRVTRLDSGSSRDDTSSPLAALAQLLSFRSRASMTDDARVVVAVSRATSVDGEEREAIVARGCRFVPACAYDRIKYTGRLLHHGAQCARKTKINTVQFDWPAVAFAVSVHGTSRVAIRLKGDGA